MFFKEIRTKKAFLTYQSALLSILYNSKFILMAMSLGTNAVVVTRVHCIKNIFSVVRINKGAWIHLTDFSAMFNKGDNFQDFLSDQTLKRAYLDNQECKVSSCGQ